MKSPLRAQKKKEPRKANEATQISYATHIPKSVNSNSTKRIKGAAAASRLMVANKNKRRRAKRKNKALRNKLHNVHVCQEKRIDDDFLKEHYLFVDGGNHDNPPIAPTSDNKKPVKVLRIADGDLCVPKIHHESGEGLILSMEGEPVFTLCQREESLRVTGMATYSADALIEAFDEAICKSNPTKRGSNCLIRSDDSSKYVCIGSATKRGGRGCWTIHHAMRQLEVDVQKKIMHHLKRIEKLFVMNLPTSVIRQVKGGINLTDAPLFSTTEGETSGIYQAFAIGKNVYLCAHEDKDFTYSAVTILTKGVYNEKDNVVAYFNFPRLGLAIPLKPGDVLFFNPKEAHMISSRCQNEDDIYCLSFYLKSNLIGGNDNSQLLTEEQEGCQWHYENIINNNHK